MNNFLEMQQFLNMMAGSLGSGLGQVWLHVALLVVMTSIVVLRRNMIVRLSAFRRAFQLLGLAIITPAIVNAMVTLLAQYMGGFGGGRIQGLPLGMDLVIPFLYGMSPILTGGSVLYLCHSLVPKFIPPDELSAGAGLSPLRRNVRGGSAEIHEAE